MTILQQQKSTSWIHQIQSNIYSWNSSFKALGQDARKQKTETSALTEAGSESFLSSPQITAPNAPGWNTVWKKYNIYKILGNSHQKCRENSWGELKLAK